MLNSAKNTQLIPGPAGQLEVAIDLPTAHAQAIFAVICHPHPLFGGSMSNKVVTTLARLYQNLGATVVRFNFRGVGNSAGEFDEGRGEIDDLRAVINWWQGVHPEQPLWLAGFSFGAYVAAKYAVLNKVDTLITVAPPVLHFPMNGMGAITCPWILAQGEQDEVVPLEAVIEWAQKQNPPPVILRFPNATHFFHGQLIELRERLAEEMKIIHHLK